MKIYLVGEAAEHVDDLKPHLADAHDIIGLPWAAATSTEFDGDITADDVIVSLRMSRDGRTAPPMRLLHVPGAGLDQIDFAALAPETMVANVFEHEIPIAEFVMARLLEWEIRGGRLQESFDPQTWPSQYRRRVRHGEIYGKTMVIVGYGRIGHAIALRAKAFGLEVIAVDDSARSDAAARVARTDQLQQVQSRADYLVLAVPLTPATTGLIDAAALTRMPAHAVLVNVSRAAIVDQMALYKALQDNEIGGAILDVWYHYPRTEDDAVVPADVPLWELPNAWCTPHSSAWTNELFRRRYALIADNINRLAAGEPLRNLVRPPGGRSSRRS